MITAQQRMKYNSRKTSPKVKFGEVQKKNRWNLTPNYYNTPQDYPIFDKEKPGQGYRHIIKKNDLYRFIDIIPEWEELSKGLSAIVLAAGSQNTLGWHVSGIIGICAWDREIRWTRCYAEFYQEHKSIFEKLNIPCKKGEKGFYTIEFEEESAKAFQLTHILIHELGHHHDRMTTKSQKSASRGEQYAETYAERYEDSLIHEYLKSFRQ